MKTLKKCLVQLFAWITVVVSMGYYHELQETELLWIVPLMVSFLALELYVWADKKYS